jgi:hypothetical protein
MAITLLDNETPESPTSVVSSGNVDTPVSGINNLKDPYEGRSLLQKKLIQDDIKLARDTIKWRQGERKKLDHNALNFEEWLPEVPKEHRVRSLIQGVMDAEMDMNPASVTSYETARVMLDRQVFGGDGSADDDAIFMKIQGRAKETKEKLEFYGKLEDEATLSALMGDDPYLKRLNPKFLFDPVFKKEKARSLQVWKDTISGIEEEYGDILPDVRKLWKMVDQDKPDLYKVADIIFKMDDDELDSAARILGKLQELQGSISSDRGVLGNIGEQSGRDKERTGSGLKGAAIGFFSKVAEGLLIEGEEITGLDNSQAIEGEQGRQENLDRSERFLAEIRRFRDQRDPIVKASKEGSFLGHVEGAVYAIPGVGMTIAASAIPIIGQANTISMLKQSAEDGYYLRALDATGDRNLSRKLAEEVSLPIVALQYLPERFGIGAITRKLPGLNKVLGKLPSAMQGRFARILAGTTARGVAETTTEEIQAILTEFGNDILNGLKEDIPEADWDAHWANFGGRNLETFLSIAPYSGLSAARHDSGLGKAVEVGKKASRDQLLASGYKSEDVDAFQSAETPLAQRSSFNKMLSNQDPKTEEAKQAVGRVIENRKATIAAHRKLLEAGTILGVRMTKDSSSYEVYDTESGEAVTTVETPAEASQIVYGAIGARDRAIQNHVDALTSKLQAARMIVDETGVTQEIEDTKWLTTEEAGRLFEGTDERIAEEVELLEQVEGGSGEVSRAVFDTVTGVNIPAGTYGRINEVTKTFMGSSISTLIHEKSHSVRRKLMANGEFTNKEQIAFFRKLNEVLKGKKTKDSIAKDGTVIKGRSLRFSGFDGETVTETAIDEAWAQFSEVMLLKSKNGKKSTMRELLNANLSAMVGDGTPGASKFKAFIRAMRDWLGLNLGRAAAINKALRDGKLDAAEMEKFRAAVMGETIQGQFENEVIETHKENFVPTENIPFSIGSTEVTPNADTRTFPTKDGGVVGPAAFSISAFHGTPHKVGRFSTDRIGTGEGAQAYGYGLYFTDTKWVGDEYRKKLGGVKLVIDGEPVGDVSRSGQGRKVEFLGRLQKEGYINFRGNNETNLGEYLEETIDTILSSMAEKEGSDVWNYAQEVKKSNVSFEEQGNLYTVNLKVEPEELLDWDKPLSEQSEKVKAALANHRPSSIPEGRSLDGMNGKYIYRMAVGDLADASGSDAAAKSASEYFARLGIPGIRFLDGNSRADGEGFYNYVIFNEADIEILEENGQPVNLSEGMKDTYSISPAQDKEYLAAVEAGDLETVQKMVDAAAKAAGYHTKAAHGTAEKFDRFSHKHGGKMTDAASARQAFFLTDDDKTARSYAVYAAEDGAIKRALAKADAAEKIGDWDGYDAALIEAESLDTDKSRYARRENATIVRAYISGDFLEFDAEGKTPQELHDGDIDAGITAEIKRAKRLGKDGVVYRNLDDAINLYDRPATHYAVFSPNQIKSADPVTYDESGNVIPLSQRFNEKDDRISFSLGQSAMVNDVISDVTSRVRDPEARADIFENIILNVDQLRRDTDKPIFGGTVTQKAIVDPREMKSLKKEAGMREALRYDELEMALDSEMRTLGSDLPVSVQDMPAHSVLIDGGYKLTTKKKAVKDGRMSETDGDFDGSDGLHPSIFGGDTMPDVAAQALAGEQVNGQTLLNEGTAQELFEVLANEWAEVQRNREMNKDAKAAIVKAKKQAKAESNAWLQERIAEQKRDYNPMARLRRSLAMLDAIMMALPIELRGKIGGFVQISKLNTEEKRLEFLKDRLDKIDNVVESWVKNNLLKDITKVRGQAKATRKGGKKPKGKLGAEGHRFFDRVENVADLSKEDIEKEEAYLFTEIAKPDGDGARSRIDLAEDLQILQVFGGLNRKNAQELAAASKLAHETYRTKRNQWRVLEENRLGQLKVLVEETIDALGNPDIAAIQEGNEVESDRKEAIKALKSVDWTILSFSEVMERLFGRDHPLAARWSKAVRQAMGARTTAITQGHRRWKKATEEATGKKGRAAQLEVWEMQTKQTIKAAPMKDEKTTVKVPIKTFLQAASRKSLGLTKEEEIEIQDKIDNLKKGSQKKYISIERVKVVPEREANFTDSQAIYLTMLFSQEGYKATMRKHGFGETFQTQLEEGMSDAAKSIREHLKEEYAENYEPLRKIFARMFGMDLPQIKGYTPGKFYSQGDDLTMDVTGSGFVEGGLMTGFLADRKSHSAEPRIESAFSVYFAHLNQTEHWKALAEVSREIRGVFGNPKVKKALKAKNERAAFAVGEWLKAIDGNGFNNPKSNKVFEWLMSTQAKLALAWKVSTIAKNFFGASVNAGFKVPLGDFIKGYGRLMNGKIDFRAMMDSELIQQRLDGGFSPEARAAINEDLGGKPTRGNQFVMMGMDVIGKADALGTAMGAAITYDYHYRMLIKEMGPEQAHDLAMDEAAEAIARTAQPVNVTDRSLMELQLTGLGKIAFIFASEARQKSAMWTQAWARTLTGKADKRDYRVLVMTHFVVAPLMHGITSALRDARNDDDDELFDEKNWGAGGWIRSVLTGPISGLPLLREIGDGFNSDDSGPLSRISNAGSSSIDLLQAIFGDEDPKKEEIEWYERKITSVLQAFGATSAVSSSVFDQMFDFIDNIGGKD